MKFDVYPSGTLRVSGEVSRTEVPPDSTTASAVIQRTTDVAKEITPPGITIIFFINVSHSK